MLWVLFTCAQRFPLPGLQPNSFPKSQQQFSVAAGLFGRIRWFPSVYSEPGCSVEREYMQTDAVICKNKAPFAMGFEPMTPGYEPADNQSSCIHCCWCLYESGLLPRRRTAHCRTHSRVTKSRQRQGTVLRWDLNPRHEDFQSPAIPLSYIWVAAGAFVTISYHSWG